MLEFIKNKYKIIDTKTGKAIDTFVTEAILTEIEEQEPSQYIELNWNNLEEQYAKFGIIFPFNIWHVRKGRRIEFIESSFFYPTIKEWKHTEIGIALEITPLIVPVENISYKDLYEQKDIQKVNKYMVEKGLTF